MTEKARRILAMLKDRNYRERLLQGLNRSTLDEGSEPVAGKDQEIKVLKEMNDLQQFENDVWNPGSM